MMARVRSLALVCSLFACGSSSAPTAKKSGDGGKPDAKEVEAGPEVAVGSIMGTIDGAPFDLRFERAQNSGDTAMGVYPTVKIALYDVLGARDACIGAQMGRALDMYVTNAADTTAVSAGTYATPDPDAGDSFGTKFAHFYFHDFVQGGLDRDIFGPGSVTLTEVSSSTVSGSFDVSLLENGADVGHLSGTFAAPVCQ
jgi:hypothetical protein